MKWEDKLGVKEGWANLGKACKGIFDQTKQDWEDPAAYKARMHAVEEVKRRHDFFCRAFDAENYHLGQDKALGYMTAEIVQALFGGEIIKGATKGATKGIQFIKKVQQGTEVGEGVAEGVKVAERVARGAKAAETAAGIAEKVKNIFKPAGELIGKQAGKDAAIRTVTKEEVERIIKQLMDAGAKKSVRQHVGYEGIWYDLPGLGKFGIRTKSSLKSTRYATTHTIDLKIDLFKDLKKLKF